MPCAGSDERQYTYRPKILKLLGQASIAAQADTSTAERLSSFGLFDGPSGARRKRKMGPDASGDPMPRASKTPLLRNIP